MNNMKSFPSFISVFSGLVCGTLSSAVIYTLAAHGTDLFYPHIIVILPISFMLALILLLPSYLLLKAVGIARPIYIAALTFLLLFVLFYSWNIYGLMNAVQFVAQGRVLVENGKIESAGYLIAARDGLITALIGSLGSVVFSLFVTSSRGNTKAKKSTSRS